MKPSLCSPRTLYVSQEITKRPLQSILLPSTRPPRFHRGGRSHPKAPHRSPLLSQSNNQSRVLSRHPLITRSDFPIKPCGRHCITRLRLLQEQVLRTQRHVHHITKVSCTHAPTIILMSRIPQSKPHHHHHHNLNYSNFLSELWNYRKFRVWQLHMCALQPGMKGDTVSSILHLSICTGLLYTSKDSLGYTNGLQFYDGPN